MMGSITNHKNCWIDCPSSVFCCAYFTFLTCSELALMKSEMLNQTNSWLEPIWPSLLQASPCKPTCCLQQLNHFITQVGDISLPEVFSGDKKTKEDRKKVPYSLLDGIQPCTTKLAVKIVFTSWTAHCTTSFEHHPLFRAPVLSVQYHHHSVSAGQLVPYLPSHLIHKLMRNVGATNVSQTSWLEHFCWSPSAELGHVKGPVQLWIYGHMHKSYIDFFSSLLNRGGFKSFFLKKKKQPFSEGA